MKPLIIVAGMHRSGTSFLSRSLNLAGMYLGELDSLASHDWIYYPDNKRGHWENISLVELADKTLHLSNSSWDAISNKISCSEKIGEELKSVLEKLSKPHSLAYGFKDPRFLLCYESWLSYIPKDFIVVGIFRHPLKVAESLAKRNNFEYEKSIELWTYYNKKLLTLMSNRSCFLINFDWSKEKIFQELKIIFNKIGLSSKINLNEWYDENLIHSDTSFNNSFSLPNETQKIYDQLQNLSTNNVKTNLRITHSLNELENIVQDMLEFSQNQGIYFKRINEHNNKRISEWDELLRHKDNQISDLTSQISNKDNQISDLTSQISNKDNQISDLTSQISNKDNQISDLTSQISNKDNQISEITIHLEKQKHKIQLLTNIITEIHQSITWKTLRRFDNLKRKFKLNLVR